MTLTSCGRYICRRVHRSRVAVIIVLVLNLFILMFVLDNSSKYTFANDELQVSPVPAHTTSCTDAEVVLALVVGSVSDAREAATCIKMIIHYQGLASLQLHIIVTDLTHYIINTLLSTWSLPQVNYRLYKVPDNIVNSSRDWSLIPFHLPKLLPATVNKVLFVDFKVRFVNDIGILWESVSNSLNIDDSVLGLISRPDCEAPTVQCWTFNLIAFDLKTARKFSKAESLSNVQSPSEVNSWLTMHTRNIFSIDYSWAVELKKGFSSSTFLSLHPIQGIVWTAGITSTYSGRRDVEAAVESVRTIVNSEPLTRLPSRVLSEPCVRPLMAADWPSGQLPLLSASCAHFRYVTGLLRRTHPCYFGGDVRSTKSVDVTLATQLTIDRMSSLELMLANWHGPASVALHVGDAALESATNYIQSSTVLKRRNVAIHIVYRRLAYNPINYLRNVAINNSRTAYTFYVDVDLIPNPGLYDSLCRRAAELQRNNSKKIALIVPSFEAFTSVSKLPNNKSELLSLMAADKIGGYRMKRGWNLGHKPTNFDHWMKTSEPYDVTYRDAFEPYVVVPTDSEPKFDERLLERMADKALYCRSLHGAGFILRVLPDAFVIHLPHALSPGIAQWRRIPGYGRCASIISDESKKELRLRYPDVKF